MKDNLPTLDLHHLSHKEVNDIVIDYIYDHDSGEVYWDDETATKRGWSDGDELLVSSLLMFGELDSRVVSLEEAD